MKLFVLALVVSISLHFLFLKNYVIEDKPLEEIQEPNSKKSSVQYVKLKKIEPKVEPKKIEPIKKEKTIKKTVEKKIVKKVKKEPKKIIKPKKTIKKVVKKERKKTVPTANKKQIQEASKLQNNILQDQIVNKKSSIQNKTLENFLNQEEPVNKEVLNELIKLYGKEYESFTKVQKAFLHKNHNSFQIITQRVLNRLGYPKLARKLRLSGSNIVEFMFYPDGSIKNLKITQSSGYSVFDKYTLNLIEIAYKDYPRPKTPTKLKFYVKYLAY